MELKNILFIIIFILALIPLFINLKTLLKKINQGKPESRTDNHTSRLNNVFEIALGQKKILRDGIAGPLHASIFWGFMIFLFAAGESIIQGIYTPFTFEFLGGGFTAISLIQDIFIVLVICALFAAYLRRYVIKIKRLDVDDKGKKDAAIVLSLIFIVVSSMLLQNAAGIAKHNFAYSENEFRPISMFVSNLLFTQSSADVFFEVFWWIHIITILVFMNYLPFSKHLHVYTSLPNVYFGKIGENKFALKNIDLEDEDVEQFGAADVKDLSWKQILDGYTCTECGRCTSVCPAANTGKPLSPRKIIENIRERSDEVYNLSEAELEAKPLVNGYITADELWSCTTCNACVTECPVMIEHVDSIVDMRRNLVLMESQFPEELNSIFHNLETNATPWAFSAQDRANWAEGLDIKTMQEDPECEYLFWVGCAGSFDSRYQKVSVAFSQIMQKAGIKFRILGTEEKCNGDTARRLGNEYLAQMMMQENVETLNNYNVKKIVTACPHCFNTFKNEYPQFGGNFEVKHHSELISELIKDKKLNFDSKSEKKRVTFHDSCYLGRYNEIYDEPRSLFNEISSVNLVEMERSKDKGFCCGAGGGRMFLEEKLGEPINVDRTKEAVSTGANQIASACPFCMTMMNDGLKSLDKQDDITVKDIAEIVIENIS